MVCRLPDAGCIPVVEGIQVGTASGGQPAPAFGTAFQVGVPAPSVIGPPGPLQLDLVVPALPGDDVDGTAGGIIIQIAPVCHPVDHFDPFDGRGRYGHIQVVGAPAVGETAFQVHPVAVDEHRHPFVPVDSHDPLGRVHHPAGDGDPRGIVQGFCHRIIMVVGDFLPGDDGDAGCHRHQICMGYGAVGVDGGRLFIGFLPQERRSLLGMGHRFLGMAFLRVRFLCPDRKGGELGQGHYGQKKGEGQFFGRKHDWDPPLQGIILRLLYHSRDGEGHFSSRHWGPLSSSTI